MMKKVEKMVKKQKIFEVTPEPSLETETGINVINSLRMILKVETPYVKGLINGRVIVTILEKGGNCIFSNDHKNGVASEVITGIVTYKNDTDEDDSEGWATKQPLRAVIKDMRGELRNDQ